MAPSTTSIGVANIIYSIRGVASDASYAIISHTRALPADSALSGRLRRKRRRSPGLPVPTFQKAGIKGLVIEPWFGYN
jgi:hypothetical protein